MKDAPVTRWISVCNLFSTTTLRSPQIREITAWLERRERRRRSSGSDSAAEERASILTVCSAVRQLLYDCGNELGWCFTEDQVNMDNDDGKYHVFHASYYRRCPTRDTNRRLGWKIFFPNIILPNH